MFRQETKTVFSLCVLLLFFASCGTTPILGLQRQEAAERFRSGDLSFITAAELPADFSGAVASLAELFQIHSAAPFYAAVMIGAYNTEESRRLQLLLFSTALRSTSQATRREAVNQLLPLVLETADTAKVQELLGFLDNANFRAREDILLLRAASLYRLELFSQAAQLLPLNPEGEWKRAVSFFAAWRAFGGGVVDETRRNDFIAFLFDLDAGNLRRWAYTQALSIHMEGFLSAGERGVIHSRRFPVSHSITLNNLRPALADGGLLFFRYPALIGDIARAYQFTPAMRAEGLELFAAWDSLLETGSGSVFSELEAFVSGLTTEEINARRYLLLHHAGRIERARGHLTASSELFRRALEFAPDTLQSDACYWFILMNTLAQNPSISAAEVFINTMPNWDNMATFNAVLDRLARILAANRDWNTMLEVFYALESKAASGSRSGTSLAQFAWILGRAAQEGFLTTNRSAESFFRTAFADPNGSAYYRTMAALQLGENFSPVAYRARRAERLRAAEGGDLEFLLGFFEYGAASFALPFVRALEENLSIPELRLVARSFADAQNWSESMRLVGRYSRRDYHRVSREDLYLSHPRPFVHIVERYAKEANVTPELLFGLIRTESFFMAEVVSHAGAVGLAQLMPATAVDIANRIVRAGGTDHRRPEGINLTDPAVNVHLGSFYLNHLIVNQMEGSPVLALKAYNGGQGRMRRWLAEDRARQDGGLPLDLFLETILYPETRNYGRLVIGAAAIYGYLYYGRSMEEVAVTFFRHSPRGVTTAHTGR